MQVQVPVFDLFPSEKDGHQSSVIIFTVTWSTNTSASRSFWLDDFINRQSYPSIAHVCVLIGRSERIYKMRPCPFLGRPSQLLGWDDGIVGPGAQRRDGIIFFIFFYIIAHHIQYPPDYYQAHNSKRASFMEGRGGGV